MSKYTLKVKSKTPPIVEYSPDISAVYIYFSKAKIKKTIDASHSNIDIAIDLDAKGNIVGIEGIGMKKFTITNVSNMMKKAKVDTRNIHLEDSTIRLPELAIA